MGCTMSLYSALSTNVEHRQSDYRFARQRSDAAWTTLERLPLRRTVLADALALLALVVIVMSAFTLAYLGGFVLTAVR